MNDLCKHCGVEIVSNKGKSLWRHSIPNLGVRRYEYKYCMLTVAEPVESGGHSVVIPFRDARQDTE